jgi:hypothetical protein
LLVVAPLVVAVKLELRDNGVRRLRETGGTDA